ncbi:MAG TPA: hypothetical protein VH560_12190, partial [Polyangia bacterium]|nr:hypothetical protein [Polyangia bacterium]
KHRQWRPDLWLRFKNRTGNIWVEGKCCEMKFHSSKRWHTKGLNTFQEQSNEANKRLTAVRNDLDASGYQVRDLLVHVHFVLANVPQEIWRSWTPKQRKAEIDNLKTEIERGNTVKSVGWNDSRFHAREGVPRNYAKNDAVYPGVFFVTQVIA